MDYFNGVVFGMSVNGVPIGLTNGWMVCYEVEDKHKGFLIGRGGGNVKRIRDKTKTQILIQEPGTQSNFGMGEGSNSSKPWFLIRGLFKRNISLAMEELAELGNKAPNYNSGYDVLEEDKMCV